ncbi:MAG: (Na+)-NQR maturation NqrM [Fidelibacterota bacterium]
MNIILAILVMGIAVFGLAVGILFNNKPLAGSCGGLEKNVIINGVEINCPTCGGDTEQCENRQFLIDQLKADQS